MHACTRTRTLMMAGQRLLRQPELRRCTRRAHPISDLSSRSHELDRLDPITCPVRVLAQKRFKKCAPLLAKHSPPGRNLAVPLRETASSCTNTIVGLASPFCKKQWQLPSRILFNRAGSGRDTTLMSPDIFRNNHLRTSRGRRHVGNT